MIEKLGDKGLPSVPEVVAGIGSAAAVGAAIGAAVGGAPPSTEQFQQGQPAPQPEAQPQPQPAPQPEAPVEDDPYAGLSPEERLAKEKEEYIWRFRILKKQYKKATIPDYNEHSDLHQMKMSYERTIKDLTLEDNVESYRTYMIGSFMVMEWVATQWVGFDLNGFTQQQMLMMHKYDRLLTELGERSYNRWGMNLPVEIRLLGFVVLQAGLFYLGKIIAEKGGSTISELFKSITGQTPGAPSVSGTAAAMAPPKKVMRGPSIKAADIHMTHADTGPDQAVPAEA